MYTEVVSQWIRLKYKKDKDSSDQSILYYEGYNNPETFVKESKSRA